MDIRDSKEVWVHGKLCGFISEEWFYPIASTQFAPEELRAIADQIDSLL